VETSENPKKGFLTAKQVMEKLNVSAITLYRMVKEKRLRVVRLSHRSYRFDPVELEEDINRMRS